MWRGSSPPSAASNEPFCLWPHRRHAGASEPCRHVVLRMIGKAPRPPPATLHCVSEPQRFNLISPRLGLEHFSSKVRNYGYSQSNFRTCILSFVEFAGLG